MSLFRLVADDLRVLRGRGQRRAHRGYTTRHSPWHVVILRVVAEKIAVVLLAERDLACNCDGCRWRHRWVRGGEWER